MDDLDDDSIDDEWAWGEPVDVDPIRTNLVGGFVSVNEQGGLPWVWPISQREMRQRCSFTRSLGTD